MIKTNGFRVPAMVMTTLWMVTIIPVTVVQAADFRGQGFDLSSYNGTVNWEQVAEADMDFVMIRTGEGRAPDVDTQFAANYDVYIWCNKFISFWLTDYSDCGYYDTKTDNSILM